MQYVIGLAALLTSSLVALFPLRWPPEWADEFGTAKEWRRWGITALLSSAAVIVAAVLKGGDSGVLQLAATAFGGGLLTVALIYSSATDFKCRLVDRRMLNISSLISALLGFSYLISEKMWLTLATSVSLLLFAGFLYLFAFMVGASDVRALVLVATASVPVIGWNGFIWASLLAGLYFIIIGFGVAFIKRTFRASFPAVPMLIFPYWFVLILTLFVSLPMAFPQLNV